MQLPQFRFNSLKQGLGFATLGVLLGLGLAAGFSRALNAQNSKAAPNILLILTDDSDFAEVAYMPNLKKLLVAQGISFNNYLVSVSLCCPSRTSILRGEYAHNTGILTNGGSNGGFETAYRLGVEKSTIATWLQSVGYRTALLGKYLNGYPRTASQTYIPPGWDEWDSPAEGHPYSEFNYTLNENGKLVAYGDRPEDYGTDVYTRKAVTFIQQSAQKKKPFFMYLALYAPHQPATPAPRHEKLFLDAKAPRTPSFNEPDVSDKPEYISKAPLLKEDAISQIDLLYRRRLQSLQAVDEAITSLINALQSNHQLDNTYIFFTSDNGFHLGQHRLAAGKQTAYEEDIRVPLIIRGPGIPVGQTRQQLVGNIDLAATFARLANAKTPDFIDGRTLVPLFKKEPPSMQSWRQMYLLGHWKEKPADTSPKPAGTREPSDMDNQSPKPLATASPRVSVASQTSIPEYRGIRSNHYTYVEYITGEKELYDISRDPAELQNLVSKASPKLLKQLADCLHKLQQCKGSSCRSAEAQLIEAQATIKPCPETKVASNR